MFLVDKPLFLCAFVALFIASAFSTASAQTPQIMPPTAPKVVAYVPNWIDLKTFADSIDYAKITHINIAFENPINEGGDLSFNKQNEVLIAKAHENNVLISVSIGGGSASGDKKLLKRYFDLMSEEKRAAFAEKLAAYVVGA